MPEFPSPPASRGGRCRRQRGASPASLVPTKPPPCVFALAREVLVPSFLRRQESRRSVGVKAAPNVRRRPIMRAALGALVGRRADGGSSHRWAVAWIPAYAGMTDRAPAAPTELIFNTVALSLRDISPPPPLRGGRAEACPCAGRGQRRPRPPASCHRRPPLCVRAGSGAAGSVIPAEAGIQAICGGQGRSQCSTAPDHARCAGGSGGPSGGWEIVAPLDGRMHSCLRRNDGQGANSAD